MSSAHCTCIFSLHYVCISRVVITVCENIVTQLSCPDISARCHFIRSWTMWHLCFRTFPLSFAFPQGNGQCMIYPLARHNGTITYWNRRSLLLWSFSCYLRLSLCFLSQREGLARVFNALFLCSQKKKSLASNPNTVQHHARCAEPHPPWKRNNL